MCVKVFVCNIDYDYLWKYKDSLGQCVCVWCVSMVFGADYLCCLSPLATACGSAGGEAGLRGPVSLTGGEEEESGQR